MPANAGPNPPPSPRYAFTQPKLIARFFSSPGGTSERIFLYFAEVRNVDKVGKGGGIDDENITLVQMTLGDLFDRLAKGSIEDPKLLIAAYWLRPSRNLSIRWWYSSG